MYITQSIANRIKSTARNKKISMKQLLSDCELNINAISEFSKGKQLSCISLARIADYLECSVDYLLGRTDEAGSPTPSDRQIRQLDLSGNELTIVKLFEKLSETQQGELIGRAKLMVEQNDENYMQDGTA